MLLYIITGLIIVLYIIDQKKPMMKKEMVIQGDIEYPFEKKALDNIENEIELVNDINNIDDIHNIQKINKPIVINEQDINQININKEDNTLNNILYNIKEINPIKTYNTWTYFEITDKDYNLPLFYHNYSIPYYFKKCIEVMKIRSPKLIVLTPMNIKEYLPDFHIEMNYMSELPLKLRVDYLYACILEKYGGICISPGTIIYNIDKQVEQLNKYELITFGSNPSIMTIDTNINYPNSYVIGSQKGSNFMKEYIRYLKLYIEKSPLYDFRVKNISCDLLSFLIGKLNPVQFHYGPDYDGTNNNFNLISSYLGTYPINFKNKERLLFISLPYDILLQETKFKWFLELSEKQFIESDLFIKKLFNKKNF